MKKNTKIYSTAFTYYPLGQLFGKNIWKLNINEKISKCYGIGDTGRHLSVNIFMCNALYAQLGSKYIM